ncbi:MAG: hypothetical protein WBR15_00660 [Gammaproteobacteria bacterium]
MLGNRASLFISLAGALILSLALCRPALAMGGYTSAQIVTGTVQDIDYLHHAITVNGQTYAVSPQAKFSGIAAFSVLHIGMPIQAMLGSTADGQSQPGAQPAAETPVIVGITWLPGGV